MKGYSFTELAKLVEAAMPRAGGAFSGNVSAPKFIGPLQGNADTATAAGRADKLSTARDITIGSTTKAFDGTGNLSWSLAEIGAIDAAATVAAAHKWATPRALQVGNSSKAVDGTANVAWSLAEIGAVNKAGDTMTGGLTFSTDSELAWVRNTDYAKIGFKNSSDSDADSFMWFRTGDNGNEYFKWQGVSGTTTSDWMTLKSSGLDVAGTVTAPTFSGALSGNAATATKLATARQINGTNFDGTASITTANWGTACTLTVGNTGKSVNGSSNTAWSLNEIGAYHPGNILGNVGFSGGTPNGAVIYRRNGGNGNVIKFADGTIIMTKGITWSGAVNKAWGALFESDTIDLGYLEDVAVAAAVSVEITPTTTGSIFHTCVTPFNTTTGKAPSIKLLRGTSISGINVEISVTVIGRWR